MNPRFSTLSSFFIIGGAALLASVIVAFLYVEPAAEAVVPPPEVYVEVATSAPPVVVTPTPAPAPTPPPAPKTPPKPTPAPVVPSQPNPPPDNPVNITVGTTTLVARSVPLLSGGTAHAGESVPVSYLQITNVGKEGALLKGFWIKQNGSARAEVVIGLSTVDDMGGSRGEVGGVEGTTPFQNGIARAPTNAFFAPGQMRLFTIQATLTSAISSYVGTELIIEVTSFETTATVKGPFPIRGTTWTIAQ